MSEKQLSDEEINEIINQEKKTKRLGSFLVFFSILLFVFGAYIHMISESNSNDFFTLDTLIIIIALIFAVAGMYFRDKAKRNAKNNAAFQLVQSALGEVFTNVEYAPEQRLHESYIKETEFFQYDTITGSDYVKATYKDVNVEMSDITLHKKEIRRSKDDISEKEVMIFKGLWMICDFHKKLSTELALIERKGLGKKLSIGGIKTESETFNKRFYIKSQSPHEAFYILTPHMMEYIIAMDEKADGYTYMYFLREGKVHIAINSRRDSFEMNSLNTNAVELRERFKSELSYITELIDELRLVDTLFEENTNKKI